MSIRHSLRHKLILFILLITLVPFVTSLCITYQLTKNYMIDQAISSNMSLIQQGKNNLVTYIDSLLLTSLTIYKDELVYQNLQLPTIDYLSDQEIFRSMQYISNSIQDIYQVYLYAYASRRSFLVTSGILQRAYNVEPQLPGNITSRKQFFILPPHLSNGSLANRYPYQRPETVISVYRPIVNALLPKEIGLLAIDVKLDLIQSICEQLYTRGEEELYIIDDRGSVIYSPDANEWGSILEEEWVSEIHSRGNSRGTFPWTSESFNGIHMYEKISVNDVDWVIVKRIPYDWLFQHARQLIFIHLLVFLLFLPLAIAGTLFISHRFTTPIQKLTQYMSEIQSGNMNVHISLHRSDEIGMLADQFNRMMRYINQLIHREYRLKLANRTNQLKALQAQMNPHFMNNALQSIGTLALQHNAPHMYNLINSLAKIMRYGMNTNETSVLLEKEIEHVRAYLSLQMQRFENQFDVEWHIAENTTHIRVPKMIIQPIVENYFKHGFDPSQSKGWLSITISIQHEDQRTMLHISIEDNGQGVPDEQLHLIQESLDLKNSQDGIGLSNILSRIELYFGSEACLRLNKRTPHGTRVEMTIPLQKKEIQP